MAAVIVATALLAVLWPRGEAQRLARLTVRGSKHAANRRVAAEDDSRAPGAITNTQRVSRPAPARRETPAEPATVATLIRDLADDDERENATRAVALLLRMGRAAIPALDAALGSRDAQQRHFAAEILRRIEGDRPSSRLLEVTVEGLRDDDVPDDRGARPYIYNAMAGVDYLSRHIDAAAAPLLRALWSRDGQQRFLAAYVIARTARRWDVDRVTELLIEHLQNNNVRHDASLSCEALFRLGPPALPHLRRYLLSRDAQQRRLVAKLIDDIESATAGKGVRTSFAGIIYDPGQRRRLVRIPTIPKKARWLALGRVRGSAAAIPELDGLRRQHGDKLLIIETSHTESSSIVEIGTNVHGIQTYLTQRLLTLRVHYNGRIERATEGADGQRRWVAATTSDR